LKTESYDIIIAGGGLSGLSLAWYLAEGNYEGKVLVIDSSFAPLNNKTWSFWAKDKPPFQQLVYKSWPRAYTCVQNNPQNHNLAPYTYHCIRSGDFKEFVLSAIKNLPNFHLLEENVLDLSGENSKPEMITKDGRHFKADYMFQSIFKPKQLSFAEIKYPLIQHFLGWEIKSKTPIFDAETITFMDFDEYWQNGVAFMYVLPWHASSALLEFTVFSHTLEDEHIYETKIYEYLEKKFGLKFSGFTIERTEKGKIPMEDRPYLPWYDTNIMNLGTVGGLTKPSTGYTFMRVQNHARQLAKTLIEGKNPALPPQSQARYRVYDLLLLHVLSTSSKKSLEVFKSLFKKNSIQQVFAFLDEDTTLTDDLKIMSSVPYIPFFKAIKANVFDRG